MQAFVQDLLYGVRLMRSTPGFTAVAVLTIALGIGVNTAVFSWVNGLLLRPVPGAGNAGELVYIETFSGVSAPGAHMSWRDYLDYQEHLTLVSGVAIGKNASFTVGPEGRPERMWGELVSGNYFSLLQVRMAAGRGFVHEEGGDRAAPVVVIADHVWKRLFNRSPRAIGSLMRVNRQQLTIVGVAPPEFRGGLPGLVYDLWIPFPMQPALGVGGSLKYRGTRDGTATFARLKPGVTIDQARQEIGAFARRLAAAEPTTNVGIGATAVTLADGHNGAQSILHGPLKILVGVGGLVLLIVCANVANLLLARAVARQREFGVRLAMGCGRGRLMRQMLTETLLLAVAGTSLGVLMSLWLRDSLNALLPAHDMPIVLSSPLDGMTLSYTIAVCVIATVICGVAPALLSAHSHLNDKLKDAGRSDSAGTGGRSARLRNLLIVSEVALACVTLTGAVLFIRSFANISAMSPGFDSSNVLVSQFYLSPSGYTAQQEVQFCHLLRQRLESLPEVTDVTYADQTPLAFGNHPLQYLTPEGYVPAPGEDMYVQRTLVGRGYFALMRIPLMEGRDFTDLDTKASAKVAVVNQTLARRYWGDTSPVGRKVRVGNAWHTVVGMVKDTKYNQPNEQAQPYFYLKYDQFFSTGLPTMLYIRTRGNPMNLIPSLRREVLALDPNVAAFHALPLAEQTSSVLLGQKVAAALLSALAAMALILAAVGLYGVMSYSVGRRTQELGLRMALGASSSDIMRTVFGGGFRLTLMGAACGVVLSLALTHTISEMLVSVASWDPIAFSAAVVVLIPVAALATFIPAWRATRLNPTDALRAE